MPSALSYNRYNLALADTIIPDIILEDGRNLRGVLSRKNISYLEHLRSIDDDLHLYRAAPSLECLKDPERSEQIFLSGMQLAFILPWERALEYCCADELREQIHAHTEEMCGAPEAADITDQDPVPTAAAQKRTSRIGLTPLFISKEKIQQAQGALENSKDIAELSASGMWSWFQRCWMYSMQLVLVQCRKKSKLPYWMRRLEKSVKEILATPHSVLEKLVRATPVFHNGHRIGWNVSVEMVLA